MRILKGRVGWVGKLAFLCGVAVIVPSLIALLLVLLAAAREIL